MSDDENKRMRNALVSDMSSHLATVHEHDQQMRQDPYNGIRVTWVRCLFHLACIDCMLCRKGEAVREVILKHAPNVGSVNDVGVSDKPFKHPGANGGLHLPDRPRME
jgi:hypothetical protein